MRVVLRVTAGPHEGREIVFDDHSTFLVGRSAKAHFRLPSKDRYFSRFHFLVEVNPPQCRVLDLKSRNGTYVNGKKVAAADLKGGDEIKAGHTRMMVSVEKSKKTVPDEDDLKPQYEVTGSFASPQSVPSGSIGMAESVGPLVGSTICAGCRSTVKHTDSRLCEPCLDKAKKRNQPLRGYTLLRELGRGGMGVVYLAIRDADGLLVALKTITPAIRPGEKEVKRFVREAEILRQLEHPNIVAYRDVMEQDGQIYFAMEYVAGQNAYRLVKEGGPLAVPRAVGLIRHLLDALSYAHNRGFVHRDIKPDNLMVESHKGRETARLTDFGLARTYQASAVSGITLTGRNGMGGTLAYMPPEQVLDFRNATPAADLYSTAATLYTLLTGKHVFNLAGQGLDQLLSAILIDDPVPIYRRRDDLPHGLVDVIHQSLEKDPKNRHASAVEMREELLPFLA